MKFVARLDGAFNNLCFSNMVLSNPGPLHVIMKYQNKTLVKNFLIALIKKWQFFISLKTNSSTFYLDLIILMPIRVARGLLNKGIIVYVYLKIQSI